MSYTYFVGKQGDETHPHYVQVYEGRDIVDAMHEFLLAIEEGDEYAVFEALLDKED